MGGEITLPDSLSRIAFIRSFLLRNGLLNSFIRRAMQLMQPIQRNSDFLTIGGIASVSSLRVCSNSNSRGNSNHRGKEYCIMWIYFVVIVHNEFATSGAQKWFRLVELWKSATPLQENRNAEDFNLSVTQRFFSRGTRKKGNMLQDYSQSFQKRGAQEYGGRMK